MDRIRSGILGLDDHMDGGFEPGALIEIAGGIGSFKSTFALQFSVQGIREKQKVRYVSLEEPMESFEKTAALFGWKKEFRKIGFQNIDIGKILKNTAGIEQPDFGSEQMAELVLSNCGKNHDRLVLDTVTTLALYASQTRPRITHSETIRTSWAHVSPSAGDIRLMLYHLAKKLRENRECTTLLLAESGQGELYLPEEVLKYVCDAKIELKKSSLGTRIPRSLMIEKMRHTNHSLDEQPLSLTSRGLKVEPL